MAIKDARCINCGSLIQVDNKEEQSYCMFCNCVFETSEGLRALENPEAFEFPNVEQAEYDGPLAQRNRARTIAPAPAQAPAPQQRKQEIPFEPKVKELPVLKIPFRLKLLVIVVLVLAIGILASISLPTIAARNGRHETITARFLQELADKNIDEDNISIQNLKSDYVVLVLDEKITEEEAVSIFNQYCAIRADVMKLDQSSFKNTHTAVTLRIATTEGGIEIAEPENESAIAGEALRLLP